MRTTGFIMLTLLLTILNACGEQVVSETISQDEKTALTTLIIVRHAEKNNESDTTTLTQEGYDRADRLSEMLANTELDAIYTTPFVRMKLTAQPTADHKKLALREYKPNDLAEIDRIIQNNLGKTVLVVGHGNTIPGIINHYCGSSLPEMLEGYHDFFVLTIDNPASSTNSYLRLWY